MRPEPLLWSWHPSQDGGEGLGTGRMFYPLRSWQTPADGWGGGGNDDLCRRDGASPAVQAWLSPGLSQLSTLGVPARPGHGETGRRESQEFPRHTARSQPPASALRQRPQTGALGPNRIHRQRVIWPLTGFETTRIPCPSISITIQASHFPTAVGPLSCMAVNPALHNPYQAPLPLCSFNACPASVGTGVI